MSTSPAPEYAARLQAFGVGVTSKDRRARELTAVYCRCKRTIARAYTWHDGRRYLWIPAHPIRSSETGRFILVPPQIFDLDGDPWAHAAVCRCGDGFLFSGSTTLAQLFPDGYIYVGHTHRGRETTAFAAGEAAAGFSFTGTTEAELLPGLVLRRLGRATTATVAQG